MRNTSDINRNKNKWPSKNPPEPLNNSVDQTRGPTTTAIPLGRIKTIMKSSLDTGQINNEVLFLVARSAEMFIQQLTKDTYENIDDGSHQVKYKHLAEIVQENDNLEFLLQIVPKKMKVRDFKHIIEEGSSESSSSDSEA